MFREHAVKVGRSRPNPRRRASFAQSAALLLLLFFFFSSLPGFAQAYWLVDITNESARFIEEEWFEAGSLVDFETTVDFEATGEPNRTDYLIGPTGKRVRATIPSYPQPIFWPWDDTERNLVCDELSIGRLAGYILLMVLPLLMIPLPYFAAQGTGNPSRYWWFIVSFFLLLHEPNVVKASFHNMAIGWDCRQARKIIASHSLYDSSSGEFRGLRPFHADEAAPLRGLLQDPKVAQDYEIMIYFAVLLIIILSFQLPAAISGAHYVFVRHPAERHVRSTSGAGGGLQVDHEGFIGSLLGADDPRQPPPEFVSENQTRRVQKLTERFRAERELAEEATRHERAAAAREDKKKP